jgi:predicted glycosyltransferase
MRVLVDVTHPALAHVFRHVVRALEAGGHECRVVARAKDVTLQVLDAYRIPYTVLARPSRTQAERVRELVVREARLAVLARRFRPHLITGTSVHAARVARVCGARSAVLNDDDAALVPWFRWLAYPLASAIITPDFLAHEGHGARHRTYRSYHSLFYLHPARFTPDPAVRGQLGLAADEPYAIVRLSGLEAHHDVGIRGVSAALLEELLRRLRRTMRVFISSERPLAPELEEHRVRIPVERLHDALAFADLLVGDSQTMATEGAVLGTPVFRVSDFAGRMSCMRDLEQYGLVSSFRPDDEAPLLAAIDEFLTRPGPERREDFRQRRARMLADKIDPLPWLLRCYDELCA